MTYFSKLRLKLMNILHFFRALFGNRETRVACTMRRYEQHKFDQALEMFRQLDPQNRTDILLSLRLFSALKHLIEDGPETVGREEYVEAVQLLARIHNITTIVLSMINGSHVDELDIDTAKKVRRIYYYKAVLSQPPGPESEALIQRLIRVSDFPGISVITDHVTPTHPKPGVSFAILWPDGAKDILARFEHLLPALVYMDHLDKEVVTARQRVVHYFKACAAKQKEDTQ